ncbi:MAG: hypothetical protein BWY66_02231 [bacterium ADurb.Bin374]|nr:MAG: hypothetical protein BWY66_02231 [bacterium ADurb.Bin374]
MLYFTMAMSVVLEPIAYRSPLNMNDLTSEPMLKLELYITGLLNTLLVVMLISARGLADMPLYPVASTPNVYDVLGASPVNV